MKINELTRFSITLALLPWIPAILLYKHSYEYYAAGILAVFILLSLICFFCKKFAHWFKSKLDAAGSFLGRYIAVFSLVIVYLAAILPTGLLMKIVKRDRLRLRKPECTSYWLEYENKNTDYEYQF